MAPPTIQPRNEERPFRFDELFFSTTDCHGVIRFGNEAFCRIADYSLDEIVSQPHNIVRHPDMPRAAFELLWNYLNAGRTVAAYVKNLAKDGRYYWVLALVVPTEDGFLSIRLKPGSDIFAAVRDVYARVLQVERDTEAAGGSRKDVIAAGVACLTQNLLDLGFANYDEFMWAALTAEMTHRQVMIAEQPSETPPQRTYDKRSAGRSDAARRDRMRSLFAKSCRLESQLGNAFARPGTFSQLRDEIVPRAEFIHKLGRSIRMLSLNAEVEAARLGQSAAALAMVAERLGVCSGEGIEVIASLNARLHQLIAPISQVVFAALVSKVQIEMTASFVREILLTPADQSTSDAELYASVNLLTQAFLKTSRDILPAIAALQSELNLAEKEVTSLWSFIRTLRFIYFTGRVETVRTTDAQAFANIFDQVRTKITESEKVLGEFLDSIQANSKQIASLGRLDGKLFDELDQLSAA